MLDFNLIFFRGNKVVVECIWLWCLKLFCGKKNLLLEVLFFLDSCLVRLGCFLDIFLEVFILSLVLMFFIL